MPRSTAYRFVSPRNHTLPKSREQVRAFLEACRLPAETVTNMLALWDEVSGRPLVRTVASSTAADDVGGWEEDAPLQLPSEVSRQVWHGFRDHTPMRPVPKEQPDVRGVDGDLELLLSRFARPVRTLSIPELYLPAAYCRGCSELGEAAAPVARRSARSVLQAGVVRVFPLFLLVIALYPMVATIRFGHLGGDGTAIVVAVEIIVVGLLLASARWIHHSRWPELLTPLRLSVAALVGIGIGVAAGIAVRSPLVGAMTGFVVFSATPSWISVTQLAGIATSSRGIFAVLTAFWSGITLGIVADLAQFPILGSVLTGILGAAMALMLLSENMASEPGRAAARAAHTRYHEPG
ncbi:hypothetical protein AB0H71_31750 [Nocardia sp. NPDC050697]|uniref:hypothetical protein n=1 Tax=Nocardia sp. NPDC050697 TaxID=3155158 RepID=UPI00340A10E5